MQHHHVGLFAGLYRADVVQSRQVTDLVVCSVQRVP
jgi:hypothetical protein